MCECLETKEALKNLKRPRLLEAALRHMYLTLFLRLFLSIFFHCTVRDLIIMFWLHLDKAIFVFAFSTDSRKVIKLVYRVDPG